MAHTVEAAGGQQAGEVEVSLKRFVGLEDGGCSSDPCERAVDKGAQCLA
jgi:hypothetical protein